MGIPDKNPFAAQKLCKKLEPKKSQAFSTGNTWGFIGHLVMLNGDSMLFNSGLVGSRIFKMADALVNAPTVCYGIDGRCTLIIYIYYYHFANGGFQWQPVNCRRDP